MKIAIYCGQAPGGLIPGDHHFMSQVWPLLAGLAGRPDVVLLGDDAMPAGFDVAPDPADRLTGLRGDRSAFSRWQAMQIGARGFLRRHRPGLLIQLHRPLPFNTGDLASVMISSDPYPDTPGRRHDDPLPGDLRRQCFTDVPLPAGNSCQLLPRGFLPDFEPASPGMRYQAWERFGAGSPYFLFAGALDNRLLPLLKAFSIFKKRQKSDWKLVLTGAPGLKDGFLKSLNQYRYRDQLVLLPDLPAMEFRELVTSAYGWINLGDSSYRLLPELLHAGVPVISVRDHYLAGIAGEHALYIGSADPALLAGELMQLYRDEDGRQALIERGKLAVGGFNWEQTASALWEHLTRSLA